LHIVQPDSLVVYKADYKGDAPIPVEKIAMTTGSSERQAFRAIGRVGQKGETLAGSIGIQWEFDKPEIADVESYKGGVVTIAAKKVGTARLTALGGGLAKEIAVEVTEQ